MAALDLGALSYTLKLKKDNSWKSGFDEAGKDIKDYQKDIKESENANKNFQDSMKGFTGSLEMTGTIFDNLDKKLKLWMLNNKENASAVEINNKAIETNKAKLTELSSQLEKGNSVLKQVKSNFGENSEQYKKTENSILDLQIAYKKVEDETKRMEESSDELKKSLNPSFFDGLKTTVANAMNGIGKSIKNGIGFSIGSDMWDKFKEGSQNILNFGSDAQKAMNELQASTGGSTKSLNNMKQTMTDIYNDNFGESFDDIGEALGIIQQNWRGNSNEIKGLTENALLLRDTFGFEVDESFRSANALVQNFGISAKDAYNLIAQGAQDGLNKNGDLLDTMNEYPVEFKSLGLNAQDMFNMLQNGAKSGGFSIDKMADAVKEFSLRAKDGSTTTQDALSKLGFNVQATEGKFSKGGNTAKQAFEDVNKRLLNLKNPLLQNQLGVELWGTQWEDLQKSGISALTNLNGSISTSKNALQDINKVKYNDLGNAFEGIKRNLQTGILLPISNEVLPELSDFSNWFTAHMPEIKQNVSSVMAVILPIIEKAFKLLGDGLSFLKQHSEGVKSALIVLLSTFGSFTVINGVVNTINNFSNALANGKTAISALKDGFDTLRIKMMYLGDGIKNASKSINDFRKSITNMVQNNAQKSIDTFKNGFSKIANGAKTAGSNIANFARIVGENAVKGLKTGADLAGKFASRLLDMGKSALSTAKDLAVTTAGIAKQGAIWLATNAKALIYKATNLAVAAAEKIAAAAQAALNLVMSMNPIGLIVIAITGLIAALVLLYNKNKWFHDEVNKIWTSLKSIFTGFVSWIKNTFTSMWNWIKSFFTKWGSTILAVIAPFIGIPLIIKQHWSQITSFFSTLGTNIKAIWNGVVNWFATLPARLYARGVAMFVSFRNGVATIVNSIGAWIAGRFASFISFFAGLGGRLRNYAVSAFNFFKNGAASIVNSIGSWIAGRFASFLNFFKNMGNTLRSRGVSAFNAFKNGAASIVNSIGSWISSKFSGFINFFKNLPKKALQWGKDILTQMKQGIENKIGSVVQSAVSLGSKLLKAIKHVFGINSPSKEMYQIGDYLVQGLTNGIVDGKDVLKDLTTSVFGGVLDFAKGAVSDAKLASWLMAALGITGQSITNLPALMSIAKHESGGNPNAINLWDSNAKAGHPSKGLMQTIDSTFSQYAIKGLGDIYNPIANAVAAIRYMISRYGSVSNVPGVRSLRNGGGYIGYQTGTTNATPGPHLTGENGPEMEWFNGGETVFNANDTQNILKIPGLIQGLINQIAKTGSLVNSAIKNLAVNSNNFNKSLITENIGSQDTQNNPIQIIVQGNTFLTKKGMDDFVTKISNTVALNVKKKGH